MLEFDNLHVTRCAKIIVGSMANIGNVFVKRLQKFCFHFPRFLRFLAFVFKFLSERLLNLWSVELMGAVVVVVGQVSLL